MLGYPTVTSGHSWGGILSRPTALFWLGVNKHLRVVTTRQQCQFLCQFVWDVHSTQWNDRCSRTDVAQHPEHECYAGSVTNTTARYRSTRVTQVLSQTLQHVIGARALRTVLSQTLQHVIGARALRTVLSQTLQHVIVARVLRRFYHKHYNRLSRDIGVLKHHHQIDIPCKIHGHVPTKAGCKLLRKAPNKLATCRTALKKQVLPRFARPWTRHRTLTFHNCN